MIATVAGSPDDLATDTAGGLWISDPVGNTLTHIAADGRTTGVIRDAGHPEGLVPLSDGRLVYSRQGPNDVVILDPVTGVTAEIVRLPHTGTGEGLDAIGVRPDGTLLIPDSPDGTLYEASLAGTPRLLASGLGRAVSAAALPDGSTLVAAEASPGLLRVGPGGGPAMSVSKLADLDDVVVSGTTAYVTVIGAGTVIAVELTTGATHTLVTGLGSAQGLAILPDGRLAIADEGRHAVHSAAPC